MFLSTTPAHFDLTGHVALVTGGSKGIGTRHGDRPRAGRRRRRHLGAPSGSGPTSTAEGLRALGARTHVVACDVADEVAIRAACDETVEALGRIDSCFANAGFGDAYDSLTIERDRWQKVHDVNVDGTFFTMREAARHMVERGGGGKLVAISSITERFGAANICSATPRARAPSGRSSAPSRSSSRDTTSR